MSRDKRLNRTQEVVGSSPISSTNQLKSFGLPRLSRCGARIDIDAVIRDLAISRHH